MTEYSTPFGLVSVPLNFSPSCLKVNVTLAGLGSPISMEHPLVPAMLAHLFLAFRTPHYFSLELCSRNQLSSHELGHRRNLPGRVRL
jgi:hypothetical protein